MHYLSRYIWHEFLQQITAKRLYMYLYSNKFQETKPQILEIIRGIWCQISALVQTQNFLYYA